MILNIYLNSKPTISPFFQTPLSLQSPMQNLNFFFIHLYQVGVDALFLSVHEVWALLFKKVLALVLNILEGLLCWIEKLYDNWFKLLLGQILNQVIWL